MWTSWLELLMKMGLMLRQSYRARMVCTAAGADKDLLLKIYKQGAELPHIMHVL